MEKKQVFDEFEKKVLEKYKHGRRIDERDRAILDRFTLIGLVRWGFNYSNMYPTAELSELGKGLLE